MIYLVIALQSLIILLILFYFLNLKKTFGYLNIKNNFKKLNRIDDLEKREQELVKILADPDIFRDKDRSLPLLNEYGEVKRKLDELMARWEYKHQELESSKKVS